MLAKSEVPSPEIKEVLRDPIEEESNAVRCNEYQWQAGDRQR
jgi:hypothetical protein